MLSATMKVGVQYPFLSQEPDDSPLVVYAQPARCFNDHCTSRIIPGEKCLC